ncbi:hypothetical protein MTO96_020796 [Rhipicephalus appendiculatus]
MFSVIAFVVAAVLCCSVQRCASDDVRATPAVPTSTPNPGGASTEELKSASNESLVEAPPPPTTQQFLAPLSVGIRFRLNENLTSPIAVHLEMQKKLTLLFGLSTWLTIPCLPNGVGSCTYDDICKIHLFSKPECLDVKTGEEIPCQCPYHEGEWRLKPSTFKVPELPPDLPSYLLDGEFVIKATVLRDGEQIGCYSTDVELNL